MSIKNILVTGSSGTIGTRLCEKLIEKGYDVLGIDLKKNKWNTGANKITLLKDLKEPLKDLSKDIDLVIHLAANARVYDLVVDPSLAKDNFLTLFNTLEFCRKNKIKRFIFASSREVYGNSSKIKHSEEEYFVKNCESPYTASKIAGEAMIHSYNGCYGINFIILRFSNVYGMYDESDRLIPLFIEAAKKNDDLIVYGNEKLLDFTYIDDAVSGILKSTIKFDEVKNNIFNISSGEGTSLVNLASFIKNRINSKSKIIIKNKRPGEVIKFIGSITKANQKIGYLPEIKIEEGIKKTIDWYNKNIF